MKSSNFAKKILFVFLFSALALLVACGSSDKEDTTDSGVVSDEDPTDDTVPADDTDPESTDDTDTAPDNADPTDDPDGPAENTDTDTDIEPTEPTTPVDGPDPEFEKEAAGCTMIEVPKITVGGLYADEINGYFSPSMGENAIDIIRIFLMGNITTGTYELGTGLNDNYAQCQQCVMVWVDAELGAAKEYYFQTRGTLTITKVAPMLNASEEEVDRTSGSIRNLIMKQVEPLNDYLGDFGFISDGKCVAAEFVEWDTTGESGN